MLASTIQFSKYGQEHQPKTTTYQANTQNPGKKHTQNPDTHTSGLVRAGPSHPSHRYRCNRDP
jgi:hypothetical protein